MTSRRRRSISRKFSRSFSKEIVSDSNSPAGLVTPERVGAELKGGSELAATPDQNATHSSKTPSLPSRPPEPEEPVISTKSEKKMVKEDVLAARHAERVLVVGKGVILTANVTSCDKVVVEGQFQGNIKTGTFVLAEGGHMQGEVRCADGCIGGNMKATILASKTLLIGKAAVVTGDMVYDNLQVMDGGRLQGKLTHYSSVHEKEEKEKEKEKETKPAPEVKA